MGAAALGQPGHLVVVGGERAALPAGEHLVREEAERPREPEGAELAPAADLGGVGAVGGVLDQGQAVLLAERRSSSIGAA